MPDLWRISNHPSLSGEGGLKYAARWHTAGRRIVYLAESPAGALIEVLVHFELDESDLPRAYTLLRIVFPKALAIAEVTLPKGESWKSDLALTRKLGDDWIAHRQTALARVPSAILPNTSNYLLNPLHPDAAGFTIASATQATFDSRLLPRLRG